jgi:IS30 family transposase
LYFLFDFPEFYVSDQGGYLRKEFLKELERITGSKRHYTTTYAPWENGTVEVVNITILRVIRSLLSDFKLTWKDWINLTLQNQGVLNHTPRRSQGQKAPIELFCRVPCQEPFSFLYTANAL